MKTANLENKIKEKDKLIAKLQEKIELIESVYSHMGLIPKNTKIRDIKTKKKVIKSINDIQNTLIVKEYEQNYPLTLSEKEFSTMKDLYSNPIYAHYPTSALHYIAKREDLLHCSVNTWYKYSKFYNLKRPFQRHNLKDYKDGRLIKQKKQSIQLNY